MTRDQSLQLIREACIKANPDIMKLQFGCEIETTRDKTRGIVIAAREFDVDVMLEGVRRSIGNRHVVSFGRPIRLADVLLAIQKNAHPNNWPKIDVFGYMTGPSKCIGWNLLSDTLTDQSDETIEFIANLLK